jgi:Tfp pilus assembly protein PilO
MKRSTLLLILLGVILVTAVWFVFLISPKRSEISDINDQIDSAAVEKLGVLGEIAALEDIRDSELTYRRANAEVERSVPATPELATFIEDVNRLAEDTDVSVATLTPSPPGVVEGQLFQALSITIEVQGQFFEILGFLYGLQDMERLVKVDSLTLAPVTDADGNQEMVASIRGSIFTLATDLPVPSVAPLEPPAEEPPAEEPPAEDAPAEEAAAIDSGDGGGA